MIEVQSLRCISKTGGLTWSINGAPMIITSDSDNHGKPTDCSLSLGLLLLPLGRGVEQTLNSTLKPDHMCAHGEGLNNGIFQQRSGKEVKAGAFITWLGGAPVMGLLFCATNG